MKKLRLTFLTIIIAITFSCQENDSITPQLDPIRIESIDPSQDQGLSAILNQYSPISSPNGRTQSFGFGEIDLNSALKAINEEDTTIRYSLLLNSKNGINFQNIVFRDRDGEVSAYIMEYQPDLYWLISNNFQFIEHSYTGILRIRDLEHNPNCRSTI